MKRLLKILWAHIRCHFYLLFVGQFRGECGFSGSNAANETIFIGAMKGSFEDPETVEFTRVFYSVQSTERWT